MTERIAMAISLFVSVAAVPLRPSNVATRLDRTTESNEQSVTVIQDYREGLASIRARNPDVRLRVDRDPSVPESRVLLIEYPAPTVDPAGRDIHCAAQTRDWSSGRAISFAIKPDHTMRLSVSFLDRNRVAYTAWRQLMGGEWQVVDIPFEEIRPNPFFQPPEAKPGAPLDVTDVAGIMFAPQDDRAGRLVVGRFVVVVDDAE